MTCSLRIAWACYNKNIKLGIAAQIFVNIGVVLLYFVNLFLTQRIVRAQHPNFGWSAFFNPLIPMMCAITVLTIIALIVALIQSFYTLDTSIHRIDRVIELYGSTAFSVIAFIPIVIITLSTLLRLVPGIRGKRALDKFGEGKMSTKIMIVIPSAALLTLAASLKSGTGYLPATPLVTPTSNPATPAAIPWYLNRGIFYAFGFGVEIVILFFYYAVRVDKRFIVPDGAKGPYSYAGGFVFAGESGNEKGRLGRDSTRNLTGSSQSLQSWGGSTRRQRSKSASRQSFVSWGGISHADTEMGIGEDGVEPLPYPPTLEDGQEIRPPSIAGAEQEMGWDAKSGRWILRPVSGTSAVSTATPASPHEPF